MNKKFISNNNSNNYKSNFVQILFNFILSSKFRTSPRMLESVTRLNDFPALKHLSIKQVLPRPVYDSIPRCVVIYSMCLIAPVSDVSDNAAHTIYDSQ